MQLRRETEAPAWRQQQDAKPFDLRPVVTNGLDRAAFHRFLASLLLFWRFRLFLHIAITAFLPTGEVVRRGFAAEVAVNTLVIHEKATGDVLGVAVGDVGH